jgi:flavin reductase (DIM6/NTAB) family NADH-FMN oxidoreductase RutF
MAQFRPVAWHHGPVSGAPLLDGALAYLECDVEAAYDGGDHTVFLGRVRWVERAGADGDPLLYFGGHYRRLETPGKP